MRKSKAMAWLLCLSLFAAMAMGSGSSSGSKKEVVQSGASSVATEAKEASSQKEDEKTEVSIDEQLLLDQDGLKVTATEYVTDGFWGDGIKLLIENDSSKDYTLCCDELIANDYMISDLFSCSVAAGKKANDVVYLSSSGLKAAGIDNVGKVEIYFRAYDDNYDDLFKDVYAEIQTSAYADMDTTPNDGGTELYNDHGVKIVGKTVDENSFWGTAILLYCENTSGANVVISVEDMSINGFMMDPFFATTVYDGKKSLDEITLFSSDLEKNGIETIEEAELKFRIYNADTYDDIVETDAITFSAQ